MDLFHSLYKIRHKYHYLNKQPTKYNHILVIISRATHGMIDEDSIKSEMDVARANIAVCARQLATVALPPDIRQRIHYDLMFNQAKLADLFAQLETSRKMDLLAAAPALPVIVRSSRARRGNDDINPRARPVPVSQPGPSQGTIGDRMS